MKSWREVEQAFLHLALAVPVVGISAAWVGQEEAGAAGERPAAERSAEPSGAWPMFRGDTHLLGVAQGSLPDELDVVFTYEAGGAVTSSPAVVGGRVYFGSDDQKVHCIDARTGEGIWTYETQDIIEAPPLVLEGTVYVGSSDADFYALDAVTGALKWKAETQDKILGGANYVRVDGKLRIVVGSYDANLYAFDAETGDEVWRYETDNYVNGTPAIWQGRTVFGGCDSILHVVSVESGEALQKIPLGAESHVAGSVAMEDGKVYFGHYGNEFVCVDLATGETVWSYASRSQPFFSSPSILPDRVVFGGRDRRLHCVRKDTGEELWSFATRRKVDGSPVVAGDKVVFGSGDGRVYVLSLEDGEEVWSYEVGKAVVSSPAVVDGRIYVGANDSRLYCFGARKERGER